MLQRNHHVAKEVIGLVPTTDNMWRCELCDVWCPSEYQKVEHITGQKHCSKLAAIEKRDDTPSCKCGVECAEKTVVKDGPNKGLCTSALQFLNCL